MQMNQNMIFSFVIIDQDMNGNILPWTQSPGEGMLFRQENTLRWAGIEELIGLIIIINDMN